MSFALNAWYCAGFASEIGHEPIARRIADIPIMIARSEAGEIRALHNRCPHRFAPLDQGERIDDTIECPYHGLRFDLEGKCVLNPHGSGRIPGAARLPSYPLVERGHFVWVWPGDPDLADPSDIPDTRLLPVGAAWSVNGHLNMPVRYQLVLDNLLDLSHAGFLHAGTLSPARSGGTSIKRDAETEIGKDRIMVRAKMSHAPVPSSQALYWKGDVGDFYSQMEWIFPGTMRHALSITKPGAGFGNGAQARLVHLITPETDTSTHYFWMHTRDTLADDRRVDHETRKMIEYAFTQEDEPMIRAVQEMMEGEEFFALKPLYLEIDEAGTRCRRIVEARIKAERGLDDGATVAARTKSTADIS